MFESDEQNWKAPPPMDSIDEGIVILFNDEHRLNVDFSILLIDDGISNSTSEEQL